jgi:hypothetical protein
MVSTAPGQPVAGMALAAQSLPTPQCVICGPANRHTRDGVYRWSGAHAGVQYRRLSVEHFSREAGRASTDGRIGITGEHAERLAYFAGV